MMKSNDKAKEILNDLLKINNDRIHGYETAVKEAPDMDLKTLFRNMADESRQYAKEIIAMIQANGDEADAGKTTNAGKIYRMWMEVKATFSGKDRETILSSCEYGEDAAQNAYRDALATTELPIEVRQLITRQQEALLTSHNLIKKYRNLQAKFDKVS